MNPAYTSDGANLEEAAARKAALVLHGLCSEDQSWVLAQLRLAQRDTVKPLLAELVALGLPRDSAIVDELLGPRHTLDELPRQEPFALAWTAPQDLARLLGDEPANLIARLLNVRTWPWQTEFTGLLPLPKRRRVEEALDRLRLQSDQGHGRPHALESALVQEVAARVSGLAPSVSPVRSGWHGLAAKARHALAMTRLLAKGERS